MADTDAPRRGGFLRILIVGALILAVIVLPFVLHVSLKRHMQLPFDVQSEYPPDRAFVSGEPFARALMALMDHELSSTTAGGPTISSSGAPRSGRTTSRTVSSASSRPIARAYGCCGTT